MNDVARLILEAWEKLGPKIKTDPHELAKRLARRRRGIMTRPVPAWCLAIRASDRRITPAHWVISPEHALDLDHPQHPYEPIEHEVTIRVHALRKYCRPVRTDSWGEQVADVSEKLGVSPSSILNARLAGKFTERYVKGLGGKRGHPVPLIHSWTTLDPSGYRHFSRPDPLWGALWEFLPDMIPDDFEQTLIRRPIYRCMLPKNHRPPELHRDDMRFMGWRWICPGCKQPTRKIYYPLAPQTLFNLLGPDPTLPQGAGMPVARPHNPRKTQHYDLNDHPVPLPTFACFRCHRIRSDTRIGNAIWNQIVTHLTAGLLFGHEVTKPDWYSPTRLNTRTRQLNRPAPRRQMVLRRLLNGWSINRIARDMHVTPTCIRIQIHHLCAQENVKNRHELARKLRAPVMPPLNQIERARLRRERVKELLLEGLPAKAIAQIIGFDLKTVILDSHEIYRQHGVGGRGPFKARQALAQKLGILLPPTRHQQLREKIASMLDAGIKKAQIARELKMSFSGICWHVQQMKRRKEESGHLDCVSLPMDKK